MNFDAFEFINDDRVNAFFTGLYFLQGGVPVKTAFYTDGPGMVFGQSGEETDIDGSGWSPLDADLHT